MALARIASEPRHASYDVVIVGGAMIGSSVAHFLSSHPRFSGRVLVVERDMTYSKCSTAHTNSCMRQQFSQEINVRISQFAADYVKNFRAHMGGDPEVPDVPLQSFGYLYLAGDERFAQVLRDNQKVQAALGAGTQILTPGEILRDYPFYNLDGIALGSLNTKDEGYFDGNTLFDTWRRKARQAGVEYLANEVVAMTRAGGRVASVTLKTGETIACGLVVNASGPRAALTAAMAGLAVPVEPRRRYTFIFDAQKRLARDLPLTIDPSGVHMRTEGDHYMCGCPPDNDTPPDFDDFEMDHSVWEEKVWPAIAARVPAFETVKLINSWVGHYEYNTLDQNAIIGPHDEVENFLFVNGFSGHGFQQAPAMGRGAAELIVDGRFTSLDLSPLGYGRIVRGEKFLERAVI